MKFVIIISILVYTVWESDAQRPLLNHTIPYNHYGSSNALPSSLHKHTSYRSGRDSYPPPSTPETDFELYRQINKAHTTLRPVRGRPGRRGSALQALKNELKQIQINEQNQTDDDPMHKKGISFRPGGVRKNSIYELKEKNKLHYQDGQSDDPQNGELITDYIPPRGLGSLNAIRNNMQMMVSNIKISEN